MSPAIIVDHQGPVTLITIDRPGARNALRAAEHEALAATFDAFSADDRRQVAIITGAGDKAFCSGHDLRQPPPAPPLPPSGFGGLTARFDLAKPVIAAVNGACLAGGFEIALACDLIVAAENATFGLPEPRVGLAALSGGLQRLTQDIGLKRAMRMALTGASVSAREGMELGFVSQLTPADALSAAQALAGEMLRCGPLSIRATKEAMLRSLDMPLADALKAQWDFPAVAAMWRSDDAVEGPLAFAERRAPRWRGR